MIFHFPYQISIKRATSIILGLALASASFAQKTDRKTLEKQRQTTQKQIETTKKILKETQSKKQQSVAVLKTLQTQIGLRKRMMSQLSRQLDAIEGEITTQNKDIVSLSEEIDQMKLQYAKLIYNGYKAKNTRSRLQFLFSSSGFNQAINRMTYLRKLAGFRKKQLQSIREKISEKTNRVLQLQETKNEKTLVLSDKEAEKRDLEVDESEANTLITELKKQESDLVKDLREKEALARKLDDAIKKAIEAEIKRAREAEEKRRREEAERLKREAEAKAKAEKTAEKPAEKTTEEKAMVIASSADIALSNQFNLNKNKLPWPVGSGFVSQAFGRHAHPTLKNITTENNGINISTTQGSKARSVFDGEVTAIVKIPGLYNTVLIKHGDYFTVYSNLDEVFVSKGDKVKVGKELGVIHTGDDGKTELHFEVWKGNEKQDPQLWLRNK